jgi:hypothetical protein
MLQGSGRKGLGVEPDRRHGERRHIVKGYLQPKPTVKGRICFCALHA